MNPRRHVQIAPDHSNEPDLRAESRDGGPVRDAWYLPGQGRKRLIFAGFDEAGYGPRLGPLVVSWTAFRVPDALVPPPANQGDRREHRVARSPKRPSAPT